MSILSAAFRGKITWPDAAVQIEGWFGRLSSPLDPAVKTIVKQGVSDAVGLADTAVSEHYAQITDAVHVGANAALLSATGGKAAPGIPIYDAAIDKIVSLGAAALHAWALELKADSAQPAADQAQAA